MKILIVTRCGQLAALQYRFQAENHDVGLLIINEKPQYHKLYDGMALKFKSKDEAFKWNPDLIVCSESGLTPISEYFKKREFPLIGRDTLQDWLEESRFEALDAASQAGIAVPYTVQMKDVDEGIEFLEHTDERFIVKYEGHTEESSLSFMGRRNSDVAHFLTAHPPKSGFILQQFAEGDEYNVEVWFSKGKPILSSLNFGVEQKKFLAGDMGPNTGSESTIVWQGDWNLPLAQAYKPTIELISHTDYTGPLDMAFIHHQDKWLFIEYTPRIGINAVYAWLEICQSDLGAWLHSVATGTPTELKLSPGYGFALTVSVPPYPYSAAKYDVGGEEVSAPEGDIGFWPHDVTTEDGKMVTAATENLIGDITSWGATPEQAIKTALDAAHDMSEKVSGLQYRIDAGKQAERIEHLNGSGVKRAPIEHEIPTDQVEDAHGITESN